MSPSQTNDLIERILKITVSWLEKCITQQVDITGIKVNTEGWLVYGLNNKIQIKSVRADKIEIKFERLALNRILYVSNSANRQPANNSNAL